MNDKEFMETLADVGMAIAGLRIDLTEKYGAETAYQMLIKMFQMATMGNETVCAEAEAAELYLKHKKGKKDARRKVSI